MAKNKLLSALVLYPVSKIYGWVMAIRNLMFDKGILLKQHSFDIPVVVVGNIAMGGAGKTPHTEYIVNALRPYYRIGVLSRGYKRRTHGFLLASPQSTVTDLGDESYQIYRKFGHHGVMVAVCENRVEGIRRMREADPSLNLIVLDDAFQHRYVKPSVSVVLMEHSRPPYEDHLLPLGHLREPMSALNRADIVVVSKCPDDMKPMETRIFKEHLNLFPYQTLHFSNYIYQELQPLFPESIPQSKRLRLSGLTQQDFALAVTGVANPVPFIRHLRSDGAKVKIKRYPDHHAFSHSDLQSILRKFSSMKGKRKILITTEKDAMRLIDSPYFPEELRPYSYYLPISVGFDPRYNEYRLEDTLGQQLRTARTLKC